MSVNISIPRRPVGLGPSNSIKHVKEHSIASSSIYSQPDEPKTNISEFSLESIQLDDDTSHIAPPVPSKHGDSIINSSPPPLPPKNTARSPIDSPTFRLADSNPRNTELWKRRSQRSNSELSFDDLKLSKSNGSTAGSAAGSPPRVQPLERSLPALPSLPRKEKSIIRKAVRSPPPPPQKNISSIPIAPIDQAPATLPLLPEAMGAKLSKLGKKESSGSSNSPSHLPGRLPTPEYQKEDKQIIHTPKIRSPASPESPESPDLPSLQKSPLRKVNDLFKGSSPQKLGSTNLPSVEVNRSTDSGLTYTHSRNTSDSDAVTIVAPTESTIFSAPQPQKGNVAAKILTPQPSSPAEPINSPTLFKSPFSARTVAFQNAGTIHPAPPVDDTHLDCFQSHRFMRPSHNIKCPLACQVCEKKDTEKRWSCTWCSLRICTKCMEVLAANQKDLRVCMEKVGKGVDQARGRSVNR